MTGYRKTHPSDEVGRHAAAELVRTGEAVIVLGISTISDERRVREVRIGLPPGDDEGSVMVMAAMLIDQLLKAVEEDS